VDKQERADQRDAAFEKQDQWEQRSAACSANGSSAWPPAQPMGAALGRLLSQSHGSIAAATRGYGKTRLTT